MEAWQRFLDYVKINTQSDEDSGSTPSTACQQALAKRLAAEKKPRKETPVNQVNYTAEAQKELSSKLGRGVRIVTGRKKGRIELEYYGLDDLNDLLEALALLRRKDKAHEI